MKTTIEIDDPLLREAKQLALRDGLTLRALFEEGLETALAKRRRPTKPFEFRDASVGGRGLTNEFKNATPDQWLELMYGTQDVDRG